MSLRSVGVLVYRVRMPTMRLQTTEQVAHTIGRTRRQVLRYVANGRLRYAAKAPGRNGAFLFHPDDVTNFKARLDRVIAGEHALEVRDEVNA